MENVNKGRPWNWLAARRVNNTQILLVAGFGIVVILSSLSVLNPSVAILSALLVLIIAVIAQRPVLIVYALTLILPLTGGLARGAIIPILRLPQALVILGFILVILAKPSCLGKVRLTTMDLVFAIFVLTEDVLPVLALYYHGDQLNFGDSQVIEALLRPFQYYILYRTVVAVVTSEKQIKTLLKLILLASIFVSIIGILQGMGIGPVRTFLQTYYPPPPNIPSYILATSRIGSTTAYYSALGAYLSFTLIIALLCYATQQTLKISSWLIAASILFDSIALVLTGTFTAWIGLAIGGAIVFIFTRRLPSVSVFVLIGFAIIVILIVFHSFIIDRLNEQLGAATAQGFVPSSFAYRIRLWTEETLPIIRQNLLFGVGPAPANAFEDSQYISLLLEGGVCYLLGYLLLMAVAIACCLYQIKSRADDIGRQLAIATFAILVAMNIMNISEEYFTYVGASQILWTLLAIIVANGQIKALEISVAAKHIDGVERKPAHPSFARLLGFTGFTTSDKPLSRNSPVKGEKSFASYSLIPYYIGSSAGNLGYAGSGISRSARSGQRFGWLERLLDWRFVKDSVVVGAGSTISRVLGLLFQTILAHFLVPDDFGFFRYVVTVSTIIAIVATAAPVSLARFLAANVHEKQARDSYFSNGVVGIVLLLVATVLISIPLLWLLHALNLGAISCIVGFAAFYGYLAIVRGLNSAWKMGLTYAVSNFALIVVLLLIIDLFKLRSVSVALMIYGLSNIVPIIVLECIRPMVLRFKFSLISKSVLLELAHFAAPLVFATGVYTIWTGIDVVFVENFDPHAVGAYAAAKTVSSAFIFVPSAITMVLLPRVAALGSDKSKLYTVGAALVAFLASMIGLVIVYVWGHKLIGLAFGERYSDAYLPLLIQSIGMSIYSVYAIIEGYVIGSGRPSLSVQALAVALIVTIITGFWLTASFGAVGASEAFTIGAVIGTVVLIFNTYFFLRKDKPAVSISS